MPKTNLSSSSRILRRIAQSEGLELEPFFLEQGLDPAKIDEPQARYPSQALFTVWARVAQVTGKPHLGLLAATHYVSVDFHALGISFLSSRSLLEALHRIDRYEQIVTSQWDYSVISQDTYTDFICEGSAMEHSMQRVAEDCRTAIIIDMCRLAIGGNFNPLEIGFMLGFSEASSFSRAFKRWTGDPPNTYREKNSDG